MPQGYLVASEEHHVRHATDFHLVERCYDFLSFALASASRGIDRTGQRAGANTEWKSSDAFTPVEAPQFSINRMRINLN